MLSPLKSKNYLELIIDKLVRKSGRNKKVVFTVRLDPMRYERRIIKGKKFSSTRMRRTSPLK